MIDPRIAHTIDARTLLAALPNASQPDLFTIRGEFARYLSGAARAGHATWQDAWNAWTGASPVQAGRIAYTTARCTVCHGRRYNLRNVSRNMARTGRPDVCAECMGTGRGQRVIRPARFIAPPKPTEPGNNTND